MQNSCERIEDNIIEFDKESLGPKKFVFLNEIFYPISDGVGNSSLALCKILIKAGHQVRVYTTRRNLAHKSYEVHEGIEIFRYRSVRIGKTFIIRAISQLLGYPLITIWLYFSLRKYKPDFILGEQMFFCGAASGFLGTLLGVKSITRAHGSDVDEVFGFWRTSLSWLSLKLNDFIITTNSEYVEKIQRRAKKRKIAILPNNMESPKLSYSREEYRKRFKLNDGNFHLMAVGRLVRVAGIETKGISFIIKAMEQLSNCMLHIFGEGPLRLEYEDSIRTHKLEQKVILHGNVPHDILLSYMKAVDALVFPSLTEGLSMTMLEAMAVGMPIIITKVGGARDYIVDGENGLFVEREDVDSIVKAVRTLQSDDELCRKLRVQSHNTFVNNFTDDVVLKRFFEILHSDVPENT